MFAPPYYHAHTCPARSAPPQTRVTLQVWHVRPSRVPVTPGGGGKKVHPLPSSVPGHKTSKLLLHGLFSGVLRRFPTLCRPTMARPPTARTHLPLAGQPSRCLRQFADHAAVRRPQVHRVWGNFPVQRACSSSRLDSRPAQALYAPFKAYGGLSRGSASSG